MKNYDDNENKLYWSVDEVRKCVYGNAISKGTIMNMIHSKQIPCKRLMSRIFIPRGWVLKEIHEASEQPSE